MSETNGKGLVVTIASKEHRVVIPPDAATRWDLVAMMENNALRGTAAILGECVPTLKLPRLSAYSYNVGKYAAEVIRLLADAGVSPAEITRQATPVAIEIARLLYPSEDEVGSAEDFSSPAGAGN